MEKKASFRECPKCGLRNKPAAAQCDFCGQSLTSDDDWQSHVKDLESLTRMDLRKPMDDKVSRRIESTIIRKDTTQYRGVEVKEVGSLEKILRDLDQNTPIKEIAVEEKKQRPQWVEPPETIVPSAEAPAPEPEERPSDSAKLEALKTPEVQEPKETPSAPSEPITVKVPEDKEPKVAEKPEVIKTEEPVKPEEEPWIEEPVIVDEVIITEPEPVVSETLVETVSITEEPTLMEEPTTREPDITVTTDSSASTIKLKLVQVVQELAPPKIETVVPIKRQRRFMVKGRMAMATLGIGIVLYLVVLGLTAMGVLDIILGLGGGAVSSAIIIYGATVTYPALRHKDLDEVYICPKCHETVDLRKENCPACGAKFRPED